MRHAFKAEIQDDGVLLTLAIKLTSEEAVRIAENSDDFNVSYPRDLVAGYKKGGMEWLLHLLRNYLHFGNFPPEFEKTRRKKR